MNDINQIIETFIIGMNMILFKKYILFFLNFI